MSRICSNWTRCVLKSFGLAPFTFHNETSLLISVINIFEKLLPCETCVFCQTCPCKPVEYTRRKHIDVTEAGFAESDHKCGGIIELSEAFDLYIDHIDNGKKESACKPREDILKSQFLLDILNDKYGLRCLIMTIPTGGNRFILLDNDNIDLPSIIDQIIEQSSSSFERRMQHVDYKLIRDCLESMDSEYDRKVCKVILTTLLKPVDQYICRINPSVAKAQLNKIKEVLEEVSNAQVAAKDMVKLRVRDRIEKLERKSKYNEKRNESQALTSRRAREIDDTISLIKDQIAREKEILNRTTHHIKTKSISNARNRLL